MADIAINPVSRRVQFTGNTGTGPFAFTFNILADEDIVVYKNTTLLTLTTDYTVSTNADGTGSVTLVAALVSSDVLTIIGGRELERTTDFVTAGDLLAESLNEQLDSLVIMAQQLDEKMTRSFKVNPGDVFTDLEMPLLDDRKGRFLQFNTTTGDPEAGPSNTSISNIADYITEIDTVGDDLNAGSYVAGGEYDFGSITDASVGATGSPDGFIVTVYNNLANVTSVAGISSDVTTVSGISSDVSTLSSNNANITTVAGSISNVNTVAGISSNVTTVAGISSDVTAVAADATDIGTVATNIASVNTVATNIADVITVANDLNEAVSEVVTVADDLNEAVSEIDTVASSISNVDTVGTNISNVNTVAGISANVTTVADNSANVTTVAGISSDVTTVATNNANVAAVAGNATNINTVAGDTADINALGPISANITTVAGVAADVTTVAGISADTTTVAGISSDVTTVAGNNANVTTVAGISSDVTTVAGDSADIQTVATNLSSINDFADKYRIGATDPTTDLDEGDLFYNTTSDTLKVYNGSAWEAGVTAGSGFLPLTGGTMTGALDVQSTVTADGLTVDGVARLQGGAPYLYLDNSSNTGSSRIYFGDADSDITGYFLYDHSTNSLRTGVNGAERMRIDSSGNVGIGTTSPNKQLTLSNPSNTSVLNLNRSNAASVDDGYGTIEFSDSSNNPLARIVGRKESGTDAYLQFLTTSDGGSVTERMRIGSNGDVGIGTDSPSSPLTVSASAATVGQFITSGSSGYVEIDNSGGGGYIGTSGDNMLFLTSTSGTERMRINAGGNILVGQSSTNFAGSGNTVTGHSFRGSGDAYHSASSNPSLSLNRNTSDGDILQFRKDGSTVGSIAVTGTNDLTLYSSTTNHKGIRLGEGYYIPTRNDGAPEDATTDIGLSSYRYKDGYFSGTVNAANFNTTSDATLKTNVETLTGSLDAVKALRGVSFDWIESGNSEVGVIAQEVEAVVPDVVSTNDQGIKSVKYGNLVGVLIEAIKEQQQRIEALEAKLGE